MNDKHVALRGKFVELMVADPTRNASEAVRLAGFLGKNTRIRACRLMKEPAVKAAIEAALEAQKKRIQFDGDRVIREIGYGAFLDPAGILDPKSKAILPLHLIPEEVRRAISSFDIEAGKLTRIKFVSKTESQRMLGEHFKLFTQKHEHSGPVPFTLVLGDKTGGDAPAAAEAKPA